MLARLEQLSLEILHLIVSHLRVDHDWQKPDRPSWYSLSLQPLLPLCLVSKRLSSTVSGSYTMSSCQATATPGIPCVIIWNGRWGLCALELLTMTPKRSFAFLHMPSSLHYQYP